MIEQLVEGFFLVTKEDLIFEVKGNVHPEERVIAYLRYVPSETGDRIAGNGIRYRKIYSLSEREAYLKENFPKYLWMDSVHGRILQSVRQSDIMFMLDPVNRLRQFRDRGVHLTPLQKASVQLANSFVEKFPLSWDSIGITGSQLSGLATLESDIDLVIYGEKEGLEFYKTFSEKFDKISGISRYSGKILDNHVAFRWGSISSKTKLREIEAGKMLQGLYKNYEFFIRIVKKSHEAGYMYSDFEFENLGLRSVRCKIIDNSNSIFTPCEYGVKCEEFPILTKLLSYRGRFTEQVGKGMIVEARGRLESVSTREKKNRFLQLVMGEDPNDILIPIKE
ncbi:MAG: nucleotidyltransferase domain-containing protein [Candidatus Thorarchaeota archaeon]